MVGTHAGDMIGEVALAIEMGADAIDIGKTIHPTQPWVRALAWRPRWLMAVAQTCHLQRNNLSEAGFFKTACGRFFYGSQVFNFSWALLEACRLELCGRH
jgi:hypothetical protein